MTLEDVKISRRSNVELFGRHILDHGRSVKQHEVLELSVVSNTNLSIYFKEEWDRLIQVRCRVEGTAERGDYRSFGRGPYFEGIDIAAVRQPQALFNKRDDGRYDYRVYAFVDLTAESEERKGGQPVARIDLRRAQFSQLICFVIGVTMGPVVFPRTNEVVISSDRFRSAYDQYAKE